MSWIATCPHETVKVLASELQTLGILSQTTLYRGIRFECDLEAAYRAHLSLRSASRIQKVVGNFQASNLTQFQSALKVIEWPNLLRSTKPFTIQPVLSDDQAQALGLEEVIHCVAESIQSATFEKGAPKFMEEAETEEAITLVPFFRDGNCVLGIDTAGRALHKRGWRTNGHPAVLKETLAASLLMLAGYTGEETFLDPMCGSGTIAIEAAYIALQKAPLIHRGKDDFALEHLAGFDRNLWRKVSDQLRAQKREALPAPIYASDLRADYVEVARASALRARVEKHLRFSSQAFQDWFPPTPKGLLLTNLPYGERIGGGTVQQLYREIGKVIRERFSEWRIGLLVPARGPLSELGLTRPQVIPLLNGSLAVSLLIQTPSVLTK